MKRTNNFYGASAVDEGSPHPLLEPQESPPQSSGNKGAFIFKICLTSFPIKCRQEGMGLNLYSESGYHQTKKASQ